MLAIVLFIQNQSISCLLVSSSGTVHIDNMIEIVALSTVTGYWLILKVSNVYEAKILPEIVLRMKGIIAYYFNVEPKTYLLK